LTGPDITSGIGPAEALYMTEIPKPSPKETQALVRVKAFGVNRADVMQRNGEYPVPPQAGKILGLEFAGIIEAFGDSPGTEFRIGDEVFGLTYGGTHSSKIVGITLRFF
jgi:NADPH:quinone reductase-like Zn-dependent oxidoreductase